MTWLKSVRRVERAHTQEHYRLLHKGTTNSPQGHIRVCASFTESEGSLAEKVHESEYGEQLIL